MAKVLVARASAADGGVRAVDEAPLLFSTGFWGWFTKWLILFRVAKKFLVASLASRQHFLFGFRVQVALYALIEIVVYSESVTSNSFESMDIKMNQSGTNLHSRDDLTLRQAAYMLNIHPQSIEEFCRYGYIEGAYQKNGQWFIPLDSLDAWLTFNDYQLNAQDHEMKHDAAARWESFRSHPFVFWPFTLISAFMVVAAFFYGLVSAGADFGPFKEQLYQWGLLQRFDKSQEEEILIVIASFYTGDDRESAIQDQLRGEINRQIADLGIINIRVEVEPEIIPSEDRERAQVIGQYYGATMVIWGSDTPFRVEANFLDMATPHTNSFFYATMSSGNQRTFLAAPDEYVLFVTNELSPQITFYALYTIGNAFLNVAEDHKGEVLIRRALANVKGTPSPLFRLNLAQTWNRLAQINLNRDNPEQVIADCNQAIALDPSSFIAYVNRGHAYARRGEIDQAIADFSQAISFNPESTYAYISRGNIYSETNFEQALADYNQVILLDPQDSYAYVQRGNVLARQRNFEQALADYNQAILLNPQDSYAFNQRGIFYEARGNPEQAIVDLDQAITLNPQDNYMYYTRSNFYLRQGNFEQALADMEQALFLNPQDAYALGQRGVIHTFWGNSEQAISDFDMAIALRPQDAYLYIFRGNFYSGQGSYEQALADFEQAIFLNPQDSYAFKQRATVYEALGNVEQAIIDYSQAITLNPNDIDYYIFRGDFFSRQNFSSEAITDYNRAILLDPQNAYIYYRRGIVYETQGYFEQAIADFNQAIALSPQNINLYGTRGDFFSRRGNIEQAIADYTQIIQLDPQNFYAYYQRGAFYETQGKLEQALDDYNQAIILNPQDANLYIKRGDIFSRQDNLEQAISDLDQAIV